MEELSQVVCLVVQKLLIYYYKMMVLFQKQWQNLGLDQLNNHSEGDEFKKILSSDFSSSSFYQNLNSLSLLSSFRDKKQFVQQKRGTKLLEEEFLKRGEGPIDFKWNKRVFSLTSEQVYY